jgi:tetratricopeptide (TPR) repeat protein
MGRPLNMRSPMRSGAWPPYRVYPRASVTSCSITRASDLNAWWTGPKDVESLALLGMIYGQQAGRSMMKAIVLGPRSMGTLDGAVALDRANPRVLLLQGISALRTPPAFGGSLEKAERLLLRSLDAFSRESATKPWPNWGRFDAHAWLGQALGRKGDLDGAWVEYNKALAIAPNSTWVRLVLLPALERTAK